MRSTSRQVVRIISVLRELRLDYNSIGREGMRALAQSPHLSNLEVLTMGDPNLDVAGLELIAHSPHMSDAVRHAYAEWFARF